MLSNKTRLPVCRCPLPGFVSLHISTAAIQQIMTLGRHAKVSTLYGIGWYEDIGERIGSSLHRIDDFEDQHFLRLKGLYQYMEALLHPRPTKLKV